MIREFDMLQLYFGDDVVVNDKITLRQPTIDDIIRIGESTYYSVVYALTSIPSDSKSALWDAGVDYMNISDLEYFHLATSGLSEEDCGIFLPGIDLSKFGLFETSDGIVFMYDRDNDIKIDMYIHTIISKYVCSLHGIKKKVERAANEVTKRILIEDDRMRKESLQKKESTSTLLPLISSVRVVMGCTKEEIRRMGIAEFMDIVYRTQTIKSVDALTAAYYSGNIDTKKFDVKKLDWSRDIYKHS